MCPARTLDRAERSILGRLRAPQSAQLVESCPSLSDLSGLLWVFAACVRAIFLFNDDDDDIKHQTWTDFFQGPKEKGHCMNGIKSTPTEFSPVVGTWE